jgi:hypothetical protein
MKISRKKRMGYQGSQVGSGAEKVLVYCQIVNLLLQKMCMFYWKMRMFYCQNVLSAGRLADVEAPGLQG